jgi:hypothetical protein
MIVSKHDKQASESVKNAKVILSESEVIANVCPFLIQTNTGTRGQWHLRFYIIDTKHSMFRVEDALVTSEDEFFLGVLNMAVQLQALICRCVSQVRMEE